MKTKFLLTCLAISLAAPFFAGSQTTNAVRQERRGRGYAPERGVYKSRITPHWFADNTKFWYRNDLASNAKEFILVDVNKSARTPAFDHAKLADALSKASGQPFKADHLPFSSIDISDDGNLLKFSAADKSWQCDLSTYECKEAPANSKATSSLIDDPQTEVADIQPINQSFLSPYSDGDDRPVHLSPQADASDDSDDAPRSRRSRRSPDEKWSAFVRGGNLFVRASDGSEKQLSQDGTTNEPYGLVEWAPNSEVVVAWRIQPGDHKEVYNIESSPAAGGRAILHQRPYALPGDKFTHYEVNLFDVASAKQTKPQVDQYDHEWEPPRLHWLQDKTRFAYEQVDRGHQRQRVIAIDSATGGVNNLADEKTDTFIWTVHTENLNVNYFNWLEKTDEMIYVSEKDGWRHLYLVDTKNGGIKSQITKGEWVIRGIDQIDEDARQVWFRAGGMNPGEDPYFIHYYRINFDGTGLTSLTDGDGNHSAQFSPDHKYIIDTYSRVDMPPIHNLRRASDGSLVCELEKADITELLATGWKPPEVFVAKGRDGKTDIWGIINRPEDLDPGKKYPVIESIYNGPQGAYVPKSFSGSHRSDALTDLGFITVQMDAMGTAFRSKAFHDVCWHNLKDAGFPDRIAWHKAAAAKYPYYDIDRVGIYGTSAGGQNAAAAVLFHPEFYKAAVANSGCHDNRMDKASWNEQWMGYPVGPQYSENSNIDNAALLRGKLFLIVGEMDSNVPPESTMRFVDALIRARKDFDLLVVPGADHGISGPAYPYAERRTREFFVRNLLHQEPPDHNAEPVAFNWKK